MIWEWANDRSTVFILDLDGTLMPSAEIDNQCFWEAVFRYFDVANSMPDLHGFKHVTDAGILEEWCIGELGRPPRVEEIERIKEQFLHLLNTAAETHPGSFTPLPGVSECLQSASRNKLVHTAIATGGWRRSAKLKLELSGLDRFNLPLASSDDAVARTEIMQIAATRAFIQQQDCRVDYFYVGDGVWDFQASQKLGWNFIGIAAGEPAELLKQAGASNIRPDFR